LAEAIYQAAHTETKSKVLNIGAGAGLSLRDLLSCIKHELGTDFRVRFEPGRAFDVKQIYLDISRAKAELGWEPKVELGEAIRATWEFIRSKF
jgi:UDP-glucose 4-epimerase